MPLIVHLLSVVHGGPTGIVIADNVDGLYFVFFTAISFHGHRLGGLLLATSSVPVRQMDLPLRLVLPKFGAELGSERRTPNRTFGSAFGFSKFPEPNFY